MTTPVIERPPMAGRLLAQAREEMIANGELVRLILAGTRRIDSWLIEQRVVPALLTTGVPLLRFEQGQRAGASRQAALMPLADGSAIACSTTQRWSPLETLEALSAIQYIGLRYASDDHWSDGFTATLTGPDRLARDITPATAANVWETATGQRPSGFASGPVDELEALGMRLIGRIFNSQGRLGL